MVKAAQNTRRTQDDRARATVSTLLAAAQTLFGRNGFDATNLDEISARAGVTKGALYHHFPDGKVMLFEAVVMRLQASLKAAMDAAAMDAHDIHGLRRVLEAYFRVATEPAFHRITLLDAPTVFGPAKWREIEHRHALQHVRAGVDRMLDQIHASNATKTMLAQTFFGACYEATFVVMAAKDRAAACALAVDTITAIIEGAYTVMLRDKGKKGLR